MNDVPLREYVDARLCELKRIIELNESNHEMAVKLAADALAIRLESMNEFRTQIDRERSTYVTREYLASARKELIAIVLGIVAIVEVLARIFHI